MNYKYLIFDLDGTLTESAPGIVRSVRYALSKRGIEVEDLAELEKFVGPPLVDSFMEFYGFSRDEALNAVYDYRAYFEAGGMFENSVYDGVPEMLRALKEAGCCLLVATSKPEKYAKMIMDHFGLTPYFDLIHGISLEDESLTKADIIRMDLEEFVGDQKAQAVMVGDRKHDVEGAALCGIPCIGVLYGYGSEEELASAGAEAVAETPADLVRLIAGA